MRDILFNFLKHITMKTHTDINIILDCSGDESYNAHKCNAFNILDKINK